MRTLRTAVPALLALLLLPALAVEAGPKKDFESHGFSWSLPDGWAFGTLSPEEKQNGIVAKADCEEASITAYIYVQESDLDVDGRVNDIKGAGGEGVGSVAKQVVKDTTLSGVKGKVVIKRIKADGGGQGHFRTYIIHTGGRFYQLIIQAWHESEKGQVAGLNGVRKGFRLAKAGKAEDADESFDEVGGGSDDAGSDSPGDSSGGNHGGGDAGGGAPQNWPANGPKLEGRCLKLDHRNVHWDLPEGPLNWVGARDDAKPAPTDLSRFAWAAGRIERKKKEFEKDTPDFNTLTMDIWVRQIPAGFKAENFIQNGGAQDFIEKNLRVLTDINTGKSRNKLDVTIGNYTGAFAKWEGEHRGANRVVMMFVVTLRSELYIFLGVGDGHTDVYRTTAPVAADMLKGIKFLETTEDQRGPIAIQSVPDFAAARGEGLGKEKSYTLPGVTFEKPPEMAKIPAGGSMERELRWAGEARSEDGKAYLYFDISAWQLNIPNTPNTDPEEVIGKRAQQWKAGAGETASRSKKDKPPFFKKGSFGKGRGLKYEFTGDLDGVPFTEEGYVVKYKNNLLRFRFQYGGEDAEKKLKDVIKAVKKGIDWNK